MCKYVFSILTCLLTGGCSQNVISVESEKKPQGTPVGYGIELLGRLDGSQVFDGKNTYIIKLPLSFAGREVAYGSAYFPGSKYFKTGNSVFFLIANYASKTPAAVFDLNGNTDFTDDPVLQIEFRKPFTVTYTNSTDQNAKVNVVYKLIDSAEYHLGLVYKSDSFRKKRKPLTYFLIEKGLTYRRVILPDGNTVSLFDIDPNGFFNDKSDRVLAGDITKDSFKTLRQNPHYVKGARSKDLLVFPNQTYRLVSVDKYGDCIRLEPLDIKIKPVDKLPTFRYFDERGETKTFKPDQSKAFTVIYFWGSWCIGCVERSPKFVKFMSAHPGLNYYTFNCGDSKERMLKYLEVKKLPFKAHQLTAKTEKELFITSFPMFFLVDRGGQILLRTGDLDLIHNFLLKNPKTSY